MANIFTHCYLPFLGVTSYTEKEEEELEGEIDEVLTAGELIKILQKVNPNTKVVWDKLDERIRLTHYRN